MWSSSAVYNLFSVIFIATYVVAIPILPFNETRADNDVAYRLPNNSRPITYDIHLTTNVHRGETKFTGVVIIDLQIQENSNTIVLHARRLTIDKVKLVSALDPSLEFSVTYSYNEITEFLSVQVQGILLPGYLLRLTIDYEGALRTDGGGFYLQSYRNPLGQPVYLATTQFESTNARHGFPCFDEPQIKAIFRLRITHGKTYNAISNMPILSVTEKYLATTQFESTDARSAFPCYDEPQQKAIFRLAISHHRTYNAISNMPALGDVVEHPDGSATTSFEPTTLTSTYLVAWTVSDYTFTEKFDRILHRVYSKPNYDEQHKFALDTSVAVLNSLIDYTEVDYPLPKLDNVAIPAKGGAMENWGMVTYGEQYLLYDEAETTTSSQTTIATIISHELAHQWFGNLVGPKWWTYTWLNEGFASLFEYVSTDQVYPQWDIMQAFISGYYRNSLINDGRVNPRPMTSYIESPAAIAGVFDYVSYGKSANVIRMIQHAFTEKTFRKALTYYQREMKYRAAVEEDLISAIKLAAMEDNSFQNPNVIETWIKSWTNQGGYPLVTITRDYSTGSITIKQEPFDGTGNVSPADRRSWWIPFNFATAKNPDFSNTGLNGHISPGTASIIVQQDGLTSDDWIIFNKQATSFYRINYDVTNWNLIADGLRKNFAGVHTFNRAALIEDAYRLARVDKLNYTVAMNLMSYLKDENQYAPWVIANTIFTTLDGYLSADTEYKTFRFFCKRMSQNFYKSLGVNESGTDAHLMKIIRGSIINLACKANNADCLEASGKKLRTALQEQKKVEPNLRAALACAGMMKASEFDMNLMVQALEWAETQVQRNQFLSGLGCMRNSTLLTQYLGLSLQTPSSMTVSERLSIVGYVVEKGATGVKAAIDFLIAKHTDYDKISTNNPVLSAIRNIANRIFTESQSRDFEALLDVVGSDSGVTAQQLQSVRNTVQSNLAWTLKYRPTIIEWTSAFYEENDGASEEEEEGGGNGGGDDGAGAIFVSTSALAIVAIGVLRTMF